MKTMHLIRCIYVGFGEIKRNKSEYLKFMRLRR